MNKLRKAWRALGLARQIVTAILLALVVAQAIVLTLSGYVALLPVIAAIALIALVQIKQSATTRDLGDDLARRNSDATRIDRALRRSQSVVKSTEEPLAALGLLREQVGRTGAQFEWLAERALAADSILAELQLAMTRTEPKLVDLGRLLEESASTANVQIAEIDREIRNSNARLTDSAASMEKRLTLAVDGGNSHSLERRIIAEVSALTLLQATRDFPGLPPFDSWAMSPLAVRFVQSVARDLPADSTIVELGSGISTAWIAFVLSRMAEPPQFVTVEHDPSYAAVTERYLASIDDGGRTRMILAPLETVRVAGESQMWYSTDWTADIRNIGLLIVDGPPAGKNHNARYPALPLLMDRLADRATILVDDAEREGESDIVAKWLKVPGVKRGSTVGRSLVLNFSRDAEGAS